MEPLCETHLAAFPVSSLKVPSYLLRSKIPADDLFMAAYLRRLYVGGGVTVPLDKVFYVAPGEETEIWDRLQDTEINPVPFLTAEFAGPEPEYCCDGRRYRKAFENPVGMGRQVVTYCSSTNRLEVGSAVLEAKRTGQDDSLESAAFSLFVCDKDNRMRLPAYLEEPLDELAFYIEEDLPHDLWELVVGPKR
jgi:hypothetical protein